MIDPATGWFEVIELPNTSVKYACDNKPSTFRPLCKSSDFQKSSNHDCCHVQWADRVLNAIKDAKSDSEESVDSNKTDSGDEKSNGDNDYHANVASALFGSNW